MVVREPQFTYRFPRPAVTVDVVLFRVGERGLETLLIERGGEPFRGRWAFPGGFLDVGPDPAHQGEELATAAGRELEEETGLPPGRIALRPFGVFGAPGRDPRGRTITVAYFALLPVDFDARARPGDDASAARWLSVPSALRRRLAFDHDVMLRAGLDALEEEVWRGSILRAVLPARFAPRRHRAAAEAVLGARFDASRHRRAWERAKQDGIVVARGGGTYAFAAGATRRGRAGGRPPGFAAS